MLPQPTDVAHRRNGRQHPTRTVRVGRGPLSVFSQATRSGGTADVTKRRAHGCATEGWINRAVRATPSAFDDVRSSVGVRREDPVPAALSCNNRRRSSHRRRPGCPGRHRGGTRYGR
jgi:hypothetical protein